MRYLILFLVVILVSLNSYSQNLKTKSKTTKHYKEVFQYDKKSKTKNGFYYKISINKKDTLVIGNFLNNQKVGLWSFNKKNGDKYFEYDYNSKKIINNYSDQLSTDSTLAKVNGENIFTKVDQPQIFLGYENEARIHLARSIKLPISIIKNNKRGQCMYSIEIDEIGKINNITIDKSLSKELDKNIISTIKEMDWEWIPAIKNGNPIPSTTFFILEVGTNNLKNKKNLPYYWHLSMNYSFTTRKVKLGQTTVRQGSPVPIRRY